VVRHLATLGQVLHVAEHIVRVVRQRHPAPERRAELAVAGEDPVFLAHRRGGAEDRRLLAVGADVEADASLALQRDQPLVQRADEDHVLVDADDQLVVDARIVGGVERAVVPLDPHDVEGRGSGLLGDRLVGAGGGDGHRGRGSLLETRSEEEAERGPP
jgi:hypothetical protein